MNTEQYFKKLNNEGFFDSHCWPQLYFLNYNSNFLNPKWRERKLCDVDYFIDFNDINHGLSRITGDDIKIGKLNIGMGRSRNKLDFEKHRKEIDILYEVDYNLIKEVKFVR